MWFYERYLQIGDLKPNAQIVVRDNIQFREYLNFNGVFPLADKAENRDKAGNLLVNIYSAITNYFMEKVWDVLPEGSGVNDNLIRELKRASFYRCLYGFGVIVRLGDRWQALDSRYYFPIVDRGEKVGSALVVPYVSTDPNRKTVAKPTNFNSNAIPDRAWTTTVIDGISDGFVQDFMYSGVTLGRRVMETRQENIDVVVFGNGVSDYDLIRPVVKEFDKLIRATSDIIERYSKPHLQAPNSAIRYDDKKNPVLHLDPEGTVLPVGNNDKEWKYLTLSSDVALHEFQARMLLGSISAITSVPLATFNIHGLPRLESGDAIETLNSPSSAKVGEWRLDIELALEQVGVECRWADTPEEQSSEMETNNDDE